MGLWDKLKSKLAKKPDAKAAAQKKLNALAKKQPVLVEVAKSLKVEPGTLLMILILAALLLVLVSLGAQLLSMAATTLYPALKTVEALQSPKPQRGVPRQESPKRKWLIFWEVYGLYLLLESLVLALVRVNFLYWVVKSLLFIALYAPDTEGALLIYSEVLAPVLERHGQSITEAAESLAEALSSALP